jgi:hypothetical protein
MRSSSSRAGKWLFGRESQASVWDGGLVITDGGDLSVRWYSMTGDLAKIARVPMPRRAVTSGDLSDIPEVFRRNGAVAPTKPWLSGLVTGPDGEVWAQRYEWPSRERVAWFVFDETGRWLGEVQGPSRLRLTNVLEDRIIGVRTDSWGVESIRSYRLTRK